MYFFFSDKQTVIDYFKLLFTHKLVNNYTLELLENNIDFLDYSFSVLPLYKLVEKTLFDMIKSKYSNELINISNGEKKIVSEVNKNELMLSNMKRFLERKGFFKNKDNLHNYILKLENWIRKDRNGYVHKDIMYVENYYSANINSINLFCMIIYYL